MPDTHHTFDVVVIGAGPGGIAAAVTAAEAGRSVAVVDDSPFAGGQIWRNRGDRPRTAQARHWLGRLKAARNVTCFQGSRVIARPGERTLLVESVECPRWLTWTSLVLATGARELFLPFPGWTLPNVVGAGAIQALVKFGLPVAGKRIVVAGSGPLLLAVAELLKAKGAIVPMILEQADARRVYGFGASLITSPGKLLAGAYMRAKLIGTQYLTGAYPLAVRPDGNALQLQYKTAAAEAAVGCDFLACGFGLLPSNEVPLLLGCDTTDRGFVKVDDHARTSVAGVLAIGELTGVGGVDKAIVEGRIAGHVAAGRDREAAGLFRAQRSALDFARRLDRAFTLRPEVLSLAEPDTIICRCEDVPLSAVTASLSVRDAKLQTRCGMGPCQGRICGPAMQRLCGIEPPQMRPPVFATTVGTLAAIES